MSGSNSEEEIEDFHDSCQVQPDEMVEDETFNEMEPSYTDLPEEILYIIFSMLHPDDLVRCGQVCHKWRQLSLYPHFWTRIFSSRSRYGHQLKLLNLRSDQVPLTRVSVWDCPRKVYLTVRGGARSDSDGGTRVRDVQSVSATLSNHLTYSLRSWLGFYPPKFMVIGSAARNLVVGGDYEIMRLSDMRFPGVNTTGLPGVNSVTLRTPMGGSQFLKWRLELALVKSYAMESHQRSTSALERLMESALLQRSPGPTTPRSNSTTSLNNAENMDWSNLRTTDVVREISSHFLAYIYIINGEFTDTEDIQLLRWEFHAFLRNFEQRPKVPVLVILSWRKVPSKLTLYQVMQYFHLTSLQNPWAVYDWDVKKRQGFMEGLTWLSMKVMS